jgi:hypothetical protein
MDGGGLDTAELLRDELALWRRAAFLIREQRNDMIRKALHIDRAEERIKELDAEAGVSEKPKDEK